MELLSSASHKLGGLRQPLRNVSRRCRFEQLEPRQLLAADLASGAPVLSSGTTGGRTGEISGNVYASQHASCDDHQADAALTEVRVQLLDENGAVLEESFTDLQGAYSFADLLPGQYAVRQMTSHGFLDGASVVGAGGGIAFGTNVVGEIVVQAGETLDGYDFCDVEGVPEPSGPADRPIVPHQDANAAVPVLALSLQPAQTERADIIYEPAIGSVTAASFVALSPLNFSRPADTFGGSSRVLNGSEEIKTWDDYLLDDLFATASFLDFDRPAETTADELADILAETDESIDESLVDGYTANSTDWWETDTRFELDELVGDTEIITMDAEQAALPETAVAEIASKRKTNPTQ